MVGFDKHQVWMTAHRSNRYSERVKEDTVHRVHGDTKVCDAPARPADPRPGAKPRPRPPASHRGLYPGGKSTSAIANTYP